MRFGQCQSQNDEIAGPARNDGWAWNDAFAGVAAAPSGCASTPPVEGNWGTPHCHPARKSQGPGLRVDLFRGS